MSNEIAQWLAIVAVALYVIAIRRSQRWRDGADWPQDWEEELLKDAPVVGQVLDPQDFPFKDRGRPVFVVWLSEDCPGCEPVREGLLREKLARDRDMVAIVDGGASYVQGVQRDFPHAEVASWTVGEGFRPPLLPFGLTLSETFVVLERAAGLAIPALLSRAIREEGGVS